MFMFCKRVSENNREKRHEEKEEKGWEEEEVVWLFCWRKGYMTYEKLLKGFLPWTLTILTERLVKKNGSITYGKQRKKKHFSK